ncbi:SusC/RagA family TonB-linked outer membrane protein [Mucilaginibacter terrae]|uniref:TonB-linked SusC/RagA family outer membrane protein n=1 Tax=Mucilaginibacter terrae TaxID=1955052 RepID=A0ABU3GZN4_9SPHI|nr:TonB-dependent receptor [Mucilaginibacter terrae]MDT3405224.1 TonB-linked SusC/RagA family outer membrane protein [Mucilaginibacter terrae]
MKKILLVLLALCTIASSNLYAQSKKITGAVTSADDGQPLPGVSVKVAGSSIGTQTSADGSFALNVPANATSLQFTYLGYATQNVSLGSGTVYNVKLVSDNKTLSEIVVTGYGVQQKREVTGSIVSIKGSEFENQPVQSFDRALQGRAAGVQVTSNSGQPGGSLTVNIRGVATINGTTQPLYIVDGVQLSSGGISGQTSVNALASINPDDIESIEILKDAASSAIYGSLAANGVVIVTTKRGKAGKTVFSASAQFGRSQMYNPYTLLTGSEYMTLQREAYVNSFLRQGYTDGVARGIAQANTANRITTADVPSYDWIDAIKRTGKVGQYDLSVSGGDTKTKFFISGSYNKTNGTIIKSNFERGTVRGNLDHRINDKLFISTSLNLSGSGQFGPGTNAGFFTNTPFTGALLTAPVNPIYNADGTFNATNFVGINTQNSVQNLNQEIRSAGTFQTVDNLALVYNILPELAFKAFGGLEFSDIRDLNYRPSTLSAAAASLGSGSETFRRNINYNVSGTFTYNKKFNEVHNISAIGGFEFRSVTQRTLGASSQTFANPLLTLVSQGAVPTAASSTFTGYKIAGFLGQLKYDYKGKYLFTANVRNDGSSRFGANQKYGLFYGFSAGWDAAAEDFLKNNNVISQLKPRISYGVVGSQPGNDYNFTALNLYGSGGQYGNPGIIGGLRPSQLENPNFTWERSAAIDLGLDYGLFGNRITGSVSVYRKKNTDLILGVTLPGDSGYTSYTQNAGSARSEGIDIDLSTINIDHKDFKWSTKFNIAFNRTKLLSLVNGLQQIQTYTYTVGRSLQNIYTYRWAGVNPADGRAMYYDANDNITYNPVAADQKIIGNQLPKFYGGLDNTISYKGLTLSALFQYQYGNSSYLQSQQYVETSGAVASNQTVNQLQRWTTPGQVTWVPRPYATNYAEPNSASLQFLSSRFVEKASYIRLKQIDLNYTLPKSVLNAVKLSSASIFVQALNLATITNYRGDDPENTGNNLNFYPNPRTYTLGINVKF